MLRVTIPSVLVALLLVPSAAAAQEPSTVGVFTGYPNLGFIWQVSNRVAVRPEISFQSNSTDTDSDIGLAGSSDFWNLGVGASALFYLSDADKLRTYVGPRFTFAHADSSSSNLGVGSGSNTYFFAGFFGAQYAPSSRFSIFGELGLGYSRSTNKSPFDDTTNTSRSFGTRTGVGIILWF